MLDQIPAEAFQTLTKVVEPQVSKLCMEVEEFIFMKKWLELVSLMITYAELKFLKGF